MRRILYIFILLCGINLTYAKSTQDEEPIIVTQEVFNMPAHEIVEIIEPLITPPSVVRGYNELIIIKAPISEIRTIKNLIAELDVPPKQLMITVVQANDNLNNHDKMVLCADIGNGNHKLNLNCIEDAQYGWNISTSRDDDKQISYVSVANGQVARISAGKEIPYVSKSLIDDDAIGSVIEYKAIDSGFYVKPVVIGDKVHLYISAQKENLTTHGGDIDTSSLYTTIIAPLDTFISLGGSKRNSNSDQYNTLLLNTHDRAKNKDNLWLKIELQ